MMRGFCGFVFFSSLSIKHKEEETFSKAGKGCVLAGVIFLFLQEGFSPVKASSWSMSEGQDGRVCQLPHSSVPQLFTGAKAQVGNLSGERWELRQIKNKKQGQSWAVLKNKALLCCSRISPFFFFPLFPSPKAHFQMVVDRL